MFWKLKISGLPSFCQLYVHTTIHLQKSSISQTHFDYTDTGGQKYLISKIHAFDELGYECHTLSQM